MRRYLIVDDNQPLAENLGEILREQGDEAVVAADPAHALHLIRERRFDALLTDMRMPVMSGAQLVREVRRIDPGLAVVVLTAYTGEADLADVQHEGILAVLPKPVPIDRMMSLLAVARRDGLVAVVEDDVSFADNLVEILRARGFTAVTAHSAQEADRLTGTRPFVALVDLQLPGSPRGEALAQLAERFQGLPLIVITGFPKLASTVQTLKTFEKPFATAQLLQTLEGLHTTRAHA